MVTVAVTGALPVFVAIKALMLPLPEATKPMDTSLFAQAYVVPATGFVKLMAVVVAPLQSVWSVTLSTEGVGFTVMVKASTGPGQPLAVGVTVTVAVTGALPVFVAVKVPMLPLPEAARPIVASLFVQAYVVPATGFVKLMAVVVAPLQSVWSVTLSTVGVGFTVMVNVSTGPGQPLAVGVTVTVAVTGALPVLVAVKAPILPLPEATKPMLALLFVQA
jgi:hypothetical protein